jgi:dCTP deaminase
MSIKSDRWIRRMAAEHGMIEPFSPEQVRIANGGKIVSYGTSSYGYDVRCADEFKIFTNINSTIVDPKSFDEKSFVDFKGAVCIIPPNSFALASTVEYFRIPRTVLTVCLGKCVTGDTRLVDADTGAYVPITEMRWGKRTLAWDGWRVQPTKVSAFMAQGTREIFELRTRAGLRIRATGNHPFLMPNRWVPLSDLRAGDPIATAREIPVFGKTPIPDWEASLLGLMIGAGDKFVPQNIFTAPEASVRLFLQVLFSGEGSVHHPDKSVFLEYCSGSRRLIEDLHHLLLRFGIFSQIRETTTAIGTRACKIQITDEDQILRFAERIGFSPGSVKQRMLDEEVLAMIAAQRSRKSNFDTLPREACAVAARAARAGVTSLSALDIRTQPDQSMPMSAAARVALAGGNPHVSPLADGPLWDVVETIEPAGFEEVYDITVPTLHNFVANDLIVHNSTYARCFGGDTRVALVDGTAPTLEEMATRHASGELFWGYSIGPNGRLIVTCLEAPRFIGRDSLLEVELDNGERIRTTPDHLFMRRDGRMAAASKLRPRDALMPLCRDLARGYERVYQPIDGFLYPTHRLADEWNLRHEIYADTPSTHRHHIDFDVEAHGAAVKDALSRRAADPRWRGQFKRLQSSQDFCHADRYEFIRKQLIEARQNPSDATREAHRRASVERFARPGERARHSRLMTEAPNYRNHKVVAIRELPGDHDVYCLSVPEAGNFGLDSGVFVKNCGIIVNVTPLEPEWEGHVTLEFSNTTPLPAKIYANEGVAQMLFLESDEVCETSYKDRGGKYQGQRGVTLPKT